MLIRSKNSHSGNPMESKSMLFVPLDARYSDICYQDEFSSYRLETPERRQSKKGKLGTKLMRVRLVLPRLRIRMLSPGRLFDKMRDSYMRLVLAHKKPDPAAVAPLHHYQSSYTSDAIAECIEFIKKSAVSQDVRLL